MAKADSKRKVTGQLPEDNRPVLFQIEEALEDYAHTFDLEWSMDFDVAHLCAWSGRLRITPEPNARNLADVSVVFHISGGESPTKLAIDLFEEAEDWIAQNLTTEEYCSPKCKAAAKKKR